MRVCAVCVSMLWFGAEGADGFQSVQGEFRGGLAGNLACLGGPVVLGVYVALYHTIRATKEGCLGCTKATAAGEYIRCHTTTV